MAYSEDLAARVRTVVAEQDEVVERKMFGGLAFMVNGHMCCGVIGDELMLRVGAEAYPETLALEHAREMDFTGRPLTGMVYVAAPGIAPDPELRAWVDRGLRFVLSLPPK